jgi:phosphoribosyl-dephospho-CoA transferase
MTRAMGDAHICSAVRSQRKRLTQSSHAVRLPQLNYIISFVVVASGSIVANSNLHSATLSGFARLSALGRKKHLFINLYLLITAGCQLSAATLSRRRPLADCRSSCAPFPLFAAESIYANALVAWVSSARSLTYYRSR